MNKDNAKDFLPLVHALAEGKTIQLKVETEGVWTDWPNPKFDREVSAYRIKPEQREWYGRIAIEGNPNYPVGTLVGATTRMEDGRPDKDDTWQYVRVREIID